MKKISLSPIISLLIWVGTVAPYLRIAEIAIVAEELSKSQNMQKTAAYHLWEKGNQKLQQGQYRGAFNLFPLA